MLHQEVLLTMLKLCYCLFWNSRSCCCFALYFLEACNYWCDRLGNCNVACCIDKKKVKAVSNSSMVVGGGMTTNFNETFSGNKIIAAYNLQEQQSNLFDSQINVQFDLAMSLTKRVGWLSPIMYFVAACGIALVMAYGNNLVVSGELTGGSFAAFVTSLLLLYKPVKGLGQTLAGLQVLLLPWGEPLNCLT